MLDDFAAEMKAGYSSSSRELDDRSRFIKSQKHAKAAGKRQGIDLSDEDIRLILLPNTEKAIAASYWLESFFQFHGEYMPNSDEVHLDPIDRITIYREYVEDLNKNDQDALSVTKFLFLWNQGFPNVRIREYKAVTGKCFACAKCSDLKREFKSAHAKQIVSEIHSLHRRTFMNERMAYYKRKVHAMENPDTVMSVISDGFAQTHCLLPWVANQVYIIFI